MAYIRFNWLTRLIDWPWFTRINITYQKNWPWWYYIIMGKWPLLIRIRESRYDQWYGNIIIWYLG